MSGAPGPLRAVLDAVAAGAGDLGTVAARTGLDRGVVSAAVAHLVRSGNLRAERLRVGCPPSGCFSCDGHAGVPDEAAASGGCRDTTTPDGAGRGPVLLTLGRRPAR